MPVNTIFTMSLKLGSTGKSVAIYDHFFYSSYTDILYQRQHRDDEWEEVCSLTKKHSSKKNCPVEKPEKFEYKILGDPFGTELPLSARTGTASHAY